MTVIRSDRRLYLTSDRSGVVEESDPRSAWLLCAAGRDVGATDVERYGLTVVDGRVVLPGMKAVPVPENKMVGLVEDKATGLPDDFPGRDSLLAAGIDSIESATGVDDLEAIPGIGKATAKKIRAYLEGAQGG